MKTSLLCGFAAAALLAVAPAQAQNLLVDPGFEDPASLTFQGPPFFGSWEGFSNGGTSTASHSTVDPNSGTGHLALHLDTPNGFAGVFQDIGATPGVNVDFSVFAADVSGQGGAGVEMRIEWRDYVANTEISRTGNFTPALTTDYSLATLSAVAPAGANSARLVFAIQSFGAAVQNVVQDVYVDDAVGTPEPTSLAMLCLAGLAVAARRR
jgi:hypothetical protein